MSSEAVTGTANAYVTKVLVEKTLDEIEYLEDKLIAHHTNFNNALLILDICR